MFSAIENRGPPSAVSRAAIYAIAWYQQHWSPKKGWGCAHRIHIGGDSCSQYAKRLIERSGLAKALPDIWNRLRSCGRAHAALSNQAVSGEGKRARSKYSDKVKKDASADACCAGCSLLSLLR